MKIGLLSDTHGDRNQMAKALCLLDDTDCLFHAGDLFRDVGWLNDRYDGPITAVIGNGDPENEGPALRFMQIDGLKIMLCHGHMQRVQRGMRRLYDNAKEKQVDIVVFGHTHVPYLDLKELILINPGPVTRQRSEWGHTCAILQTSPQLEVFFYNLDRGNLLLHRALA